MKAEARWWRDFSRALLEGLTGEERELYLDALKSKGFVTERGRPTEKLLRLRDRKKMEWGHLKFRPKDMSSFLAMAMALDILYPGRVPMDMLNPKEVAKTAPLLLEIEPEGGLCLLDYPECASCPAARWCSLLNMVSGGEDPLPFWRGMSFEQFSTLCLRREGSSCSEGHPCAEGSCPWFGRRRLK